MTTKLSRNQYASQSRIPLINMRRSIFPINYDRKMTFNASFLTPIMCKRVIPGASFFIDLNYFIRMFTQLTCPLDNLQVETFFFYAPDRILWENHKYFLGERKNYNENTTYLMPQIEIPAEKNTAGSLWNQLSGSRIGKKVKVSKLPFVMHNLTYNEYFLDTDCMNYKKVDTTDTDGDINDYELYRIHKSRDYFTNATRDIQIGESVKVPIGTEAPVVGDGNSVGIYGQKGNKNTIYCMASRDEDSNNFESIQFGNYVKNAGVATTLLSTNNANSVFSVGITKDPNKSGLKALLNESAGATIQALANAILTNEYEQALNRGGTRYVDIMNNIYRVTIPDLTIQRPAYLGGTYSLLGTTPVIQTSGTGSAETPQGNIAGFGINSEMNQRVINASFQEFGYIIGYVVIKAQPQYQQGLNHFWTEQDKLDLFNPYFVNAPDHAIRQSEIYLEDYDKMSDDGITLENDKVYGYIGMYDYYRYFNNEISGEFNSEYQYTLDSWHYAEKLENAPATNESFMLDHTDKILERSMAVIYENEEKTIKAPQFMGQFKFNGAISLPIPTHAVSKISAYIK